MNTPHTTSQQPHRHCTSILLHTCTKRGTVTVDSMLILARTVLMALAILLPIALFMTFTSLTIDTGQLEADLLAYRLLISPSGLGFYDTQLQQAPLGIIDASKWEAATKNPSVLASFARYPERIFGARITIGPLSAYYNKEIYDDYAVIAKTKLPGPGGATLYLQEVPVVLRQATTDVPATARVEVVKLR